ncbi:hypothetical protein GCM10009731_19370 [Streptomyces globosus]
MGVHPFYRQERAGRSEWKEVGGLVRRADFRPTLPRNPPPVSTGPDVTSTSTGVGHACGRGANGWPTGCTVAQKCFAAWVGGCVK